jgi:hypothetical protein
MEKQHPMQHRRREIIFVMNNIDSQSLDAGVKSMRMYSILNFNAAVGSVFITGVEEEELEDVQLQTPLSER